MALCDNCPIARTRETCTDLCEAAIEYVDQDYIPLREITIGIPTAGRWPQHKKRVKLTPKEKNIVTLLGKGLSRQDVCQLLKITRVTLRNHLCRIKKKY
jgi:DNA-binding NarL/FixJ family response regulator